MWNRPAAWTVAGTLAAALLAMSAPATAQPRARDAPRSSPAVQATMSGPERTYDKPGDAILAADLGGVIAKARQTTPASSLSPAIAAVVVMDDLAAGRPSSARSSLDSLPDRYQGGVKDMLEAWVLLGERDRAGAVARAKDASARLPGKLGGVLEALIAESTGDLAGADAVYTRVRATLDVTPPPEDEPSSVEEAMRQLGAAQTTQVLYRAALVKHRLGQRDEARRLYDLVDKFAPNSPDIDANMARLARNEAPLEPALDPVRGLGRWALFLSEEFGRSEGLAQVIADPTPQQGLVSPTSSLLAQMGIALDPSATDWEIGAGYTLVQADGFDGAEKLFRRIPADSVYGPDAAIGLAEVALKRHDNGRAVSEAQRAARLAPNRWTIALAVATVLTRADRDVAAISAYDEALARATQAKDKADILIARAAAHNYFGRTDRAAADGRAAVAADGRPAIKIAAVGYLMENPDGWTEAVRLGRELLTEKPESVARLNQLGYTLIHRPEGLEEGYRLLSRGAALGENDYAVVDSLGWAYYLYGNFEEALRLIERANELSPEPISEILDHLGDVQWRLGQQDAAREAWKKALDAKPEAPRRTSLQQKISGGLTTPAPARRTPPALEPFTPGQRSDT